MGPKSSRPAASLSEETRQLAISIFSEIDTDGSRTIDKEETIRWWNNNFARINAKAMFDAVDADHNGEIDLDEWLGF